MQRQNNSILLEDKVQEHGNATPSSRVQRGNVEGDGETTLR